MPSGESTAPNVSERLLIRQALEHPFGSPRLCELAKGKKNVVIITSDHTRPVPSHIIIPELLKEIRTGNPKAEVHILIATGCHRAPTPEEMLSKFGKELIENEIFIAHDCDRSEMIELEALPSGGKLILNKMAVHADLLVSDGFVEPHFFAGFSGGRKSVLPGVAARSTVMYNHNGTFINSPYARQGVLDKNPLHQDMLFAAHMAKLAFIYNVVLGKEKNILFAVAGNAEDAHQKACDYVSDAFAVKPSMADIVITTNGGYPLDQNIYQAVKGMTGAEATVKEKGVIIMLAKSEDGHGGQGFYDLFTGKKDYTAMHESFIKTPPEKTVPDQWQAQILTRIMLKASVIYISQAPDEVVENFGMIPAKDIHEALKMAEKILNNPDATITVIPDGVGVIIKGEA